MRRFLCMILVMLLAVGPVSGLAYTNWPEEWPEMPESMEPEITVKLDGERLSFDQQPIWQLDRVMVPMRVIFEALGCTVGWDEGTRTAAAEKDGVAIHLQIDNELMYRNGEMVVLDAVPCQIGDRTLVPIRAVSEALGASVFWEHYENCVAIFSSEYRENPPLKLQTEYLDCIGKKQAEVAAVFGPVSGVEGPVQSAMFHHRDSAGDVWFEYDGARPDKDGQIVPIDAAACISIRGPLSAFLPEMPERLSEGEAALYFGELDLLQHVTFLGQEALVHAGDKYMSTKEKYSVYITGIDDGNGVYRDSLVWFYITDSYYLDIMF